MIANDVPVPTAGASHDDGTTVVAVLGDAVAGAELTGFAGEGEFVGVMTGGSVDLLRLGEGGRRLV